MLNQLCSAILAHRLPLGCLFLLSMLVGCSGHPNAASQAETGARSASGPVRVVCTTGMVADLVKNVGGKWVAVSALMGEGIDPHLYKPSTGDVAKLEQAEVIFYSGLHLEGKMGELFEHLARRKRVFAISAEIPHADLLKVGAEQFDPHIWFDVKLWSRCTGLVARELSKLDPTHAADYQIQATLFQQQLHELDTFCREQLALVPEPRRVLVTAHDAFSYFGRAYHIEVKAIQGVSTDSEAGVREINELVEFIAQRQVKAVFVETSVDPRNVRALIEGCAARGHAVTVGGSLYSDAMGAADSPEGTYVGMVRKNVSLMVAALK